MDHPTQRHSQPTSRGTGTRRLAASMTAGTVGALMAVLTLAVPSVAAAGGTNGPVDPNSSNPPVFDSFDEPFEVQVDDFCVPGLSVDVSGTQHTDLKILTKQSGLAFFQAHVVVDQTVTGLASGVSVSIHTAFIEKDLKVVDNGDGTLTVTDLLTGPSTTYGPDGKAIARDPGQIRLELQVNTNGTPDDPSDDFVTSQDQVKGSTGRSDDFCAAVVPVIS